jgi:hypothetical protein
LNGNIQFDFDGRATARASCRNGDAGVQRNDRPRCDHRRSRFFYFVTDVIAVSHAGFAINNNGGDPSFLDARSLGALAFAESFLENSTFMAGEAFSLSNPKTLAECG